MTPETREAITGHAAEVFPRESCGLVVVRKGRERYWPCRNLAEGADQFQLHHEDYARAEENGDILSIVHSHPNLAPVPSQADLVGCEASGVPWVIIGWPSNTLYEFAPTGYKAPLVGRVFCLGRLDCYTLIKDYYLEELQIVLPDFVRKGEWWMRGEDLYRQNFETAGFYRVEEAALRKHDVLLIQLASNISNHGAVYLGDGRILHHPMNRLSGREMYGGYWQKNTTHVLRHQELV